MLNCEEKEPILDFSHLEEKEVENLIHIVSEICEDLLERNIILIKVGTYDV